MTGPTTVSRSSGSPTFSTFAMPASLPTSSSTIDECAITRVGAVQIWPEWNVHTLPIVPTAVAMSASPNTTAEPLPPSSRSRRFMLRPATSAMRQPTAVDPVKLIMSTSGDSTIASDGGTCDELTTFTTPGGNPASSKSSHMRMTPSGSCSGGFTTTVLPIARAGASLPDMFVTGKLYDAKQPTTPTGARCSIPPMIPPGASAVVGMTAGGGGTMFDSTCA